MSLSDLDTGPDRGQCHVADCYDRAAITGTLTLRADVLTGLLPDQRDHVLELALCSDHAHTLRIERGPDNTGPELVDFRLLWP